MSTDFLRNIGKLKQFGGTVDIGTSASRGGITSIAGSNSLIESGASTQHILNLNADLMRLTEGAKYAAQIPDITKAINENFGSIAQTFNKLGATITVKDATGQGTTEIATQKQTGLPGQSITDSLGTGFGQVGDFLKSNPLIIFGILAIVGIKVLK